MNIPKPILIIAIIIVAGIGIAFANEINAQTYYATGTLVSKNMFSPSTQVGSIDYFGYNCTIPASTTLQVQFNQDNTNWYSSTGTANGWDTLSNGDHLAIGDAINLSALNWDGPYFYYKMKFETADTSTTPILDEIKVYYTVGSYGKYYASSTLVSKNLFSPSDAVGSIDYFGYNCTTTAAATLKIQFSQNNNDWYSSTGTLNGWDTLSNGNHLDTDRINLAALNWSGPYFYYKAKFETSDTSTTPILDEIKVYYTVGSYGKYYASGTLVSKNLLSGQTVINIDTFFASSTVPVGTNLKIQFSTNTTDWYSANGVLNGWTYLPDGQSKIILSQLNWATPNFYYKMKFETYEQGRTPILDEIQVDYNIYHSPQLKGSIRIKGGTILK